MAPRRRTPGPSGLTGIGALLVSVLTVAFLALKGCDDVSVNVLEVAVVELSPSELTLFEGQEESVSATVRASDGRVLTGRSVRWSSDDAEVAVVSSSGEVRGEGVGATTIRAEAEGVEASVPVDVLRWPVIALSTSELGFEATAGEGSPPPKEVEIANEGDGELSGLSAAVDTEGPEGVDWLSASLAGSAAPTTLAVAVTTGDLSPGEYQGTVDVSSPVAENSPRQILVTFEVKEPPPRIRVDPPSVALSSTARSPEPATQTVEVTNVGGGVLDGLSATIQYEDGPSGWLSAQFEGTVAPTTLNLAASAQNLSAGTYEAGVVVSSPVAVGGTRTVRVVFQVSPGRGPGPDSGVRR